MAKLKNLSGKKAGYVKMHLTSKQGSVISSFNRLVEAFGQPEYIEAENRDKSQVEWIIEKDGIVATIYDYYQLNDDLSEIQQWNVGGHNYEASVLVNVLLAS